MARLSLQVLLLLVSLLTLWRSCGHGRGGSNAHGKQQGKSATLRIEMRWRGTFAAVMTGSRPPLVTDLSVAQSNIYMAMVLSPPLKIRKCINHDFLSKCVLAPLNAKSHIHNFFRYIFCACFKSMCTPTNQTSNFTEEEYDPRIDTMMECVYQTIFPIFLAFGFLTNLVNILVLRNLKNKKMKKQLNQAVTTTLNYLITLAATQMVACIGLCFSIIHLDRESLAYGWAFYYAHYDIPIVNASTSASVYIVVGLSIDRFIAVCLPDYYTRVSAPYLAKFRIIAALIVPILLYIPNSLSTSVVCGKDGMGWTYVPNINSNFEWFYFLLFEELCHRIFPALILVVLNISIIIGFRKLSKKREKFLKKPKEEPNKSLVTKKEDTSSRQSQENFLLFLLVSIVIAFLVTTLPAAVLALTDTIGTSLATFEFEVGRFTGDVLRVWDYGIMTPTSWYYDHDVNVMAIWDLGTMTLK
ncbi:unnamed protein product, partial [Meganyctiphanes norvegica]